MLYWFLSMRMLLLLQFDLAHPIGVLQLQNPIHFEPPASNISHPAAQKKVSFLDLKDTVFFQND